MPRIDHALVEAARRGDAEALDALLRAARPQVRKYAERHCIAHAEDATQETLVTVHRKLPTLRSVAAFPAWLLRIVARVCLSLVTPLWRRIEEIKADEREAQSHPLPIETRMDLAKAVDALPDSYRSAILMHYYQDVPVADIAAQLAITPAAVKVRLHRGRECVRRFLAAGEGA